MVILFTFRWIILNTILKASQLESTFMIISSPADYRKAAKRKLPRFLFLMMILGRISG
jgi:hypothetical protein